MPRQTQKIYWEKQWSQRKLDKQIETGPKKAWWPILKCILKNLPKDAFIVEAGCGMGQFVYLIDRMEKKIIGIDIASQTLSQTKSFFPHLQLLIQDVRRLGIATKKVHLLISLGVVEHFEEGPHRVLAEAARVVRPGGYLFITVPYTNLYRRIREPWRRFKQHNTDQKGQVFYQYTFSRKWFCKLLEQHGFRTELVLLHHSHVAIKKDLPWLIRLGIPNLKNRFSETQRYRRWGERIDRLSPLLVSHMLLVVARHF
jgi:SAM-dependent methyltransferase